MLFCGHMLATGGGSGCGGFVPGLGKHRYRLFAGNLHADTAHRAVNSSSVLHDRRHGSELTAAVCALDVHNLNQSKNPVGKISISFRLTRIFLPRKKQTVLRTCVPEFLNNFCRSFSRGVRLARGKRDRADACVTAAAVTLTDFCQIHHIRLLGPRV